MDAKSRHAITALIHDFRWTISSGAKTRTLKADRCREVADALAVLITEHKSATGMLMSMDQVGFTRER